MDPLAMALLAISALARTIVYVCSIVLGFREKTYCIPLWALGLNICWEIIYACAGISDPQMQNIANAVWACCDILIVVTYFKYGRAFLPKRIQPYFVPYSVLVFVSCLLFQLAFFLQFDDQVVSGQFSAFAQNAIMSVLFVGMLIRRQSSKGQSMLIAVAKCLGTLAPTIQHGLVQGFNIYVLCMGTFVFVWDMVYIVLLHRQIKQERQRSLP